MIGVLGLSPEEWTAIGSIAGVATLLLTLLVMLRSRSDRRDDESYAETEAQEEEFEKEPKAEDPRQVEPGPQRVALRRITSGRVLLDMAGTALMYQLDHDDPRTEEEVELVGNALDTFRDYCDIHDAIDPGDRVRVGFELTALIDELQQAGWVIYGTTTNRPIRIAGKTEVFPTAVVVIKRSPAIAQAA